MQPTTNATQGNQVKISEIETAMAGMLSETLRRGFHGKAILELVIQDGTVQYIRRVVEKVEK
ncbi:MAG TPA: hypothetical protein VGI75_04270 [Pirellulales bacterium]|jgi:hypothetical protein